MGRHSAPPPPRVRPRVGRMVAAGTALAVTGVALLGGIGVIDLDAGPATDAFASTAVVGTVQSPTPEAPEAPEAPAPEPEKAATAADPGGTAQQGGAELPEDAGDGRRVIFSIAEQRVWLVNDRDQPVSTYLVSGSLTKNLKPGRYDVYSRSRWAVGIDDSGVMEYFVRFTRGQNAPIGFHSIPTKLGKPLQTEAQLGTPQSHGCIRQRLADAKRLWDFAPVGTQVVVV